MADTNSEDTVFQLGRLSFSIRGSDRALVERLSRLYATSDRKVADRIFDLDKQNEIAEESLLRFQHGAEIEPVRLVNQRGLDHHLGCLWLDAAALATGDGKLVLITGASHSGKSTTALALAIGHGWKVINEDIALIDPANDELITFSSPWSLRRTSVERITEATGVVPGPIYDEEWVPVGKHAANKKYQAKFDLALHFSIVDADREEPLKVETLNCHEYIRKVLPISNALRIEPGLTKLAEYLSGATCCYFHGGSLIDRLTEIVHLANMPGQNCGAQSRPAES